MNMIKKISVFVLCIILTLSICACHPKDEIAVTIGDVKLTSATYMCMLLAADSEARTTIDENLSEQGVTDTTDINYYAQKVDGTDYTEWVKNRAMGLCKRYAIYEIKAKEFGIELDEEDIEVSKQYTDMYWDYGLGSIYDANGVSYNTYLVANENNQLGNKVFEKLYGEGGEKGIEKATVMESMYENFEIANIIDVSITNMSDEDVASNKAKLEGYIERLNNGTSFEEIYVEHNKLTDHSHDEDSQEDAPLDLHASLIGSVDTDYADDDFDTIKQMSVGEIKLIEDDDALRLVIRGDITADSYYEENLYSTVLWMLYDEDFEDYIAEFYDDYQTVVNDYAVDRFKVKKLVRE